MNANVVVAVALVVSLANPPVGTATEIKIFTARAIATVPAEIGGKSARSIAYLRVGSGVYLDGLIQRLGIDIAIR